MEQVDQTELYADTHKAIDRAVRLLTEDKENTAVKTGFPDLDFFIHGLQPGEVILVGGRPSMGKTSFALSVMEHVAIENKQTCLFFSAEDSAVNVAKRLIRMGSGIPFSHPERVSAENKERVIAAANRMKETPILIEDKAYPSAEWIFRTCTQYKKLDIRLIVIDYLQLISNEDFPEKPADMFHVMPMLKMIATQMNCPVMVLTQLTRATETRKNHRPLVTDIRDHTDVVDKADNILLLYRDDYYYIPEDRPDVVPGLTELIIARQIDGPAGTVRLMFQKESGRFVPYEEVKLPTEELQEMIDDTEIEIDLDDAENSIRQMASPSQSGLTALSALQEAEQLAGDGKYEEAYRIAKESGVSSLSEYRDRFLELVETCADHGSYDAMRYLVEKYWNQQISDREKKFKYLHALEEIDDYTSYSKLGICYMDGIGCRIDEEKAYRYFAEAMLFGGYKASPLKPLSYYEFDESACVDGIKALKQGRYQTAYDLFIMSVFWYKDVQAYEKLADMYANGWGVPVDQKKARLLYKEALRVVNGHVFADTWEAAYKLGICFLYGQGGPDNPIFAEIMLSRVLEELQWEEEQGYPVKRDVFSNVRRELEKARTADLSAYHIIQTSSGMYITEGVEEWLKLDEDLLDRWIQMEPYLSVGYGI